MYNPFKRYELPTREEVEGVNDYLSKNKYYSSGIPTIKYFWIKSFYQTFIEGALYANRLMYVFDKKKEFEFKCDQIMNFSRFTIQQSMIEKKDKHFYASGAIQIPMDDIGKCSQYHDFKKSLDNMGCRMIELSEDKTELMIYHLKTNNLSILDTYKSS